MVGAIRIGILYLVVLLTVLEWQQRALSRKSLVGWGCPRSISVVEMIGVLLLMVAFVGDSITTGAYPGDVEQLSKGAMQVRSFATKHARLGAIQLKVSAALEAKPDYLVLQGGVNDCMVKSNSPTVNAKIVIRGVVKAWKQVDKTDTKIVMVKPYPWGGYDEAGWECSKEFNSWLNESDVVDDFFDVIVIETGSMGRNGRLKKQFDAGDGLHLSREGNRELARLVYDGLLKARGR